MPTNGSIVVVDRRRINAARRPGRQDAAMGGNLRQ
jgi:hypothetical protein